MPAELSINYGFESPPQPQLRVVEEKREPQGQLAVWVNHLDTNWREEGLPEDWYNFGRAGFSMRSQMALLTDLEPASISTWAERTEQDIRGFTVEYLKQELVHPSFYRKEYQNGKLRLIDEKYGKEIEDMVLEAERGGSVRAAIREVKEHIENGGKAAVISSPKGETGLTTDEGEPIEYPDYWMFGIIDLGDFVVNFGVKTDFSAEEGREAIRKMTGKILSPDAKPEEYVRSVAKIEQGQGIDSPMDLSSAMASLRSGTAYEDRGWDEVHDRVGRLTELYGLEIKAEGYVQEFRDYVAESGHTKLELQKALTATLLRLSDLYLFNEKQTINGESYSTVDNVIYPERFNRGFSGVRMGEVLKKVEKIPGCAGGGSKGSAVQSILERMGLSSPTDAKKDPNLCRCGGGEPHFHCPGKKDGKSCNNPIIVGKGITKCASCGTGKVC